MAFVLVGACLAFDASAADRDAWKHPDSRFAAIDDAVDDDDYATAQKLLADLRAEAKRSNDQSLLAEALESGKEVARLSREFGKIAKHIKTLKERPKNGKASLAVGKYFCVVKGNWSQGLARLALGEDATLAALAADDNESPVHTDDQVAIADRWWQYSQKVSDADERIAYQLRARQWMIKALPGADAKARATIDQRLKQVPLFIDRLVVWNMHNGGYNDRGADELLVSLFYQDKLVWKDSTVIPWTANKPAYIMLRPKHVRADQVRVDVTKPHNRGAGLGEIEVIIGRRNIARDCEPTVDSYFEFNEAYKPSRLVDGDTSGNAGFWAAENGKESWASIHLAEFAPAK
jgi:hypothetical protein